MADTEARAMAAEVSAVLAEAAASAAAERREAGNLIFYSGEFY